MNHIDIHEADPRCTNERAIEVIQLALKAKMKAIIEQGFEGWNGEISSFGYTVEVSIDMKERPHD